MSVLSTGHAALCPALPQAATGSLSGSSKLTQFSSKRSLGKALLVVGGYFFKTQEPAWYSVW